MSNRILWLVFAICGLSLAAAAAPQPDERVAKQLADAGYSEVETDEDGDYQLVVKFKEDDRSQLIFVISETYSLDHMEVREIWAPVCRRELSAEEMHMLLEESFQNTLGFYAVAGDTLFFCARLNAACTAEELDDAIREVAVGADEMEKTLTGEKDEF